MIICHSPEILGHLGLIPRFVTIIPVRDNSEVVIIDLDIYLPNYLPSHLPTHLSIDQSKYLSTILHQHVVNVPKNM